MLCTPCFANDQVIVAQMTRKLIEEYKIWSLEINTNKIQCMCIGGQQEDLVLNDENTAMITSIQAQKSHMMGTLDKAIKNISTAGIKAITLLYNMLWDRKINKDNKKRICETTVKSIPLYGVEVWSLKGRRLSNLRRRKMTSGEGKAGKS